jgi:hypothetical protein
MRALPEVCEGMSGCPTTRPIAWGHCTDYYRVTRHPPIGKRSAQIWDMNSREFVQPRELAAIAEILCKAHIVFPKRSGFRLHQFGHFGSGTALLRF